MSRYLITCHGCTCRVQTPWCVETPYGVALFLWGKNVAHHAVFEGECPYYFMLGNFDAIRVTMQRYPFHLVSHILPLDIPAKALWEYGVRRGGEDGDALVCRIGGSRP